jgi:dTDP-4-dehydrorhamnose 3,5-epimerase
LHYKCSNFYNKSAEGTILFNDPQLKINWFVEEPIVSAKDMEGEEFQNFISPF